MDKLNDIRLQINQIDDEIMSLLDKRYHLTKDIGILKKENKTEVLDTNREDFILSKASKYSHYPQIKSVYTTIMNESKKEQRK